MKYLAFLIFILVIILPSCRNSLIGVGVSGNKGNLFLEPGLDDQTAAGFYLEYRWKYMESKHGVGADYKLGVRGYSKMYGEGGDIIMHSFEGKYYYQIYARRFSKFTIDLVGGLGYVGFPTLSNTEKRAVTSNVGVEFRFPKNRIFSVMPRFNYIRNFPDWRYNTSVELSVGVRLRE